MFNKILVSLIGVAALAGLVFFTAKEHKSDMIGSVSIGNNYQATTTALGATAGTYVITSVPGTLGSVVIVSTSAVGGLTIYDTDSVTTTATTTIVVFPTSTPAGTYTFDTNLFQGLSIQVPSGFNGQFITTYRP